MLSLSLHISFIKYSTKNKNNTKSRFLNFQFNAIKKYNSAKDTVVSFAMLFEISKFQVYIYSDKSNIFPQINSQ